jgi:DNA-directed RNA polymerase subunit RPC12/RpoP
VSAQRPEKYGVDAELERLLACPECGSAKVRPTRQSMGSYGFFGFKAIGDLSSSREVSCHSCGAQWVRPSIRELRREAERRIDERYERFEAENQRLLSELARDRLTPTTTSGEEEPAN